MSSPKARSSWKVASPWLIAVALGTLLVSLATYWVGVITASELKATANERLTLYQGTLAGALDKYRYLPFILSRDEDIIELLTESDGRQGMAIAVSRSLAATNLKAESDVLYVMNARGTTLAASNWQDERSFVGHNYSFRPYYKDAMQGREGRFFAIGTISGVPGFYMSHPVHSGGSIVGSVVVKVDLRPLQKQWSAGGETVFMTDKNGVIFLSSEDDWRYRSLAPINEEAMAQIRAERQYVGAELAPLDLRTRTLSRAEAMEIGGELFLISALDVAEQNWRLHYLSPVTLIKERQRATFIIGAALIVLLLTGTLFLRERRLKIQSSRRAREAEKFRAINELLEAEVKERRKTEQELRDTQAELVQAGKLAALGQMSAAIAHEINQPIAAIRTFVASTRLLLEKGRLEGLDSSLKEISDLTERMGAITGQLKTFARKAPTRLQPVDLRDIITKAASLMRPILKTEGVELEFRSPAAPVLVMGDEIRLEQIFVNLFRNAADAMKQAEQKHITVELQAEGQSGIVTVRDTGTGMSQEVLDNLFDPFFTTKEVGEGIGLGLSITYGIVKDLDGDIHARNTVNGGAEFQLKFPLCEITNVA